MGGSYGVVSQVREFLLAIRQRHQYAQPDPDRQSLPFAALAIQDRRGAIWAAELFFSAQR